jgi:hypothetical protein
MGGTINREKANKLGFFCLVDQIGEELPHSWNADSL